MRLLLLDTCGSEGSVALADSKRGTPIVAQQEMPGRTASERLVGVVRAMLGEAGWKLDELDAIAVVTGPGSFTGVRVGLSAAKGLSEASGVPLIGISRLAMLAGSAGAGNQRVCALLDAGRGQLYCGEYAGAIKLDERLVSRDDALSATAAAVRTVVCEGSVFEALRDLAAVQMAAEPTAGDALPFAMTRILEGSFDDPMTLDANYLRRTDEEIFAKPLARRSD